MQKFAPRLLLARQMFAQGHEAACRRCAIDGLAVASACPKRAHLADVVEPVDDAGIAGFGRNSGRRGYANPGSGPCGDFVGADAMGQILGGIDPQVPRSRENLVCLLCGRRKQYSEQSPTRSTTLCPNNVQATLSNYGKLLNRDREKYLSRTTMWGAVAVLALRG